MSKNRTRVERTAARQRFEDKEKHAEIFAASIKQSREYRQLQGSRNSRMNQQSGSLAGLKRTPSFYRFEGVLIEQGMMISDVVDKWALIDELQSEVEQTQSTGRKGKLQRRKIEQLSVLIDAHQITTPSF